MTSSGQATDAVVRVLFVCTGNTCRSPMAETLFRKLVARKLDCRDWELRERGIDVFSAGISAGESDPAAREAVQIMRETGLDLSQHLSQQVTAPMLDESTIVLTMTERHRHVLLESVSRSLRQNSLTQPGRRGYCGPDWWNDRRLPLLCTADQRKPTTLD